MKIKIILFVIILMMLLGAAKAYGIITTPDTQCTTSHTTASQLPKEVKKAQDFFDAGNYYYDIGKCQEAVGQYTKAIELNPTFAQAYNNRAYTNMRLHHYQEALLDLNKAISLKSNYIQALMNRGDLYNYYGPVIDRQKALEDYKKVISLGAIRDTSVCGHTAMAETNNMIPLAFLKFIFNRGNCR